MEYRSPEALEQAIKAAAKASPIDTNRAISGFYFHRLLCRVFSEEKPPFVLKGGQAMLARTVDARSTRDIDLLSTVQEINSALAELKRLAEIDLGDYITFEFAGAHAIKAEDEYRSGTCISFTPLFGAKRLQTISVDLVVDEVSCDFTERITPADRVDVRGVPVFDYAVYPVAYAVADKLCAIFETHEDRASSRVKDLVDILVYQSTETIDGTTIADRVKIEQASRKLSLPLSFRLPATWHNTYRSVFTKLCGQTGLADNLHSLTEAEVFAGTFINPVLSSEVAGKQWSFKNLQWL